MQLTDLPPELLLEIYCSTSGPSDACALSRTCRYLSELRTAHAAKIYCALAPYHLPISAFNLLELQAWARPFPKNADEAAAHGSLQSFYRQMLDNERVVRAATAKFDTYWHIHRPRRQQGLPGRFSVMWLSALPASGTCFCDDASCRKLRALTPSEAQRFADLFYTGWRLVLLLKKAGIEYVQDEYARRKFRWLRSMELLVRWIVDGAEFDEKCPRFGVEHSDWVELWASLDEEVFNRAYALGIRTSFKTLADCEWKTPVGDYSYFLSRIYPDDA